jgi:hypothetical protein
LGPKFHYAPNRLFQPSNRNCFALIRIEQHRTKSQNPALSFHQ